MSKGERHKEKPSRRRLDDSNGRASRQTGRKITRKERVQRILWFCYVLVCLAVTFTISYYLTDWVYRWLGWTVSGLVTQLVNSFVGIFLLGTCIHIISIVFRGHILAGELRIYGPIIEAMDKIAKGDFKVSVDQTFTNSPQERVVGELVTSVNKMAVELGQLETMRQEFISNVSHEIQSPLTSIRGFAQVLRSDGLNAMERDHYLTIIEAESNRLSKLSDNLLKLASLEAEQIKFEVKSYRLDRQIRNLILACEPQWLGKDLDLEVALEEITVSGDEDLLSQVWLNLLHNSIKFTPHDGRIGIGLSWCEDKIAFKISDSGIGIAEEDQSHIFERFYKADKSRTGLHGGSGLGLSITSKIIEMHHGTIQVQSQLAAGTTFTIYLPVS